MRRCITNNYSPSDRRFNIQNGAKKNGDTEAYKALPRKEIFRTFNVVRRNTSKIKFGGSKPDDLNDSLSFSTKEQLKALTNYPTLSDPFGPERGCPSTQTTRDGSGPMSASARICPSGGDPCGAQTCGSWPRMQSIAADCAPMARMLHQRRV